MSLAGVGRTKHRRYTAAAGDGVATGWRGKGNRHRPTRRSLTLLSRDAIRHTCASSAAKPSRLRDERWRRAFEFAPQVSWDRAYILLDRRLPASTPPANTHSKRSFNCLSERAAGSVPGKSKASFWG